MEHHCIYKHFSGCAFLLGKASHRAVWVSVWMYRNVHKGTTYEWGGAFCLEDNKARGCKNFRCYGENYGTFSTEWNSSRHIRTPPQQQIYLYTSPTVQHTGPRHPHGFLPAGLFQHGAATGRTLVLVPQFQIQPVWGPVPSARDTPNIKCLRWGLSKRLLRKSRLTAPGIHHNAYLHRGSVNAMGGDTWKHNSTFSTRQPPTRKGKVIPPKVSEPSFEREGF